jgi:drug/metabolite transporter (DMT)-like permease
MNDDGNTAFVGVIGLLTSLTLQQINAMMAFLVALATLTYVCYGIGNRRLIRKRLQSESKKPQRDESASD